MPKKPECEETAHLQEVLLAQMIQVDTFASLLNEKRVITQEQLLEKLKAVKSECEIRKSTSA
jgi:hypothetical protein